MSVPIIVDQQQQAKPLTLGVSIFTDVQALEAKQMPVTWDFLKEKLSEPSEYASKGKCPLIKLARFGDKRTAAGSLRSDANMTGVYGVECDYDGEVMTVAQAAGLLHAAGVTAFIYTSPSHTSAKPRWRVLAPLSCEHAPSDRAVYVARLNAVLGGVLAPESFTPSQAFYFSRVTGAEYETAAIEGTPLDLHTGLQAEVYPQGKTAAKADAAGVDNDLAEVDRDRVLDRVTDETLADLRSALSVNPSTGRPYIDPDNRESWVSVAHALKSLGADGFDLWQEWSALSPKWDDGGSDPAAVWDSCAGSRALYTSIFAKAQAGGWVNPKSAEGIKASITAATRIDRTDAGNVAVLHTLVGGRLRWITETKSWLWWTGERWEPDNRGDLSHSAALQVGEHYVKEADKLRKQAEAEGLDEIERKHLLKAANNMHGWAQTCRNRQRLDNMLGLAKVDARFALSAAELDQDPWLFGVANGVVDLRVGSLREVGRDDYVTRRSPVAFNPDAKCPRWLQFIAEITGKPAPDRGIEKRPDLAAYLHKMLGYAMTGSVREQKMFIAVGDGSNGKSVLIDVLAWIMGSYCQDIPPAALMATKYESGAESATPYASTLAGARVATSSEAKAGQRLDAALIKRNTGDSRMTARPVYGSPITFDITHKLILLTNHKPAMDHLDGAVKGRMHMVPFEMRWNRPGDSERDPNRPDGDKSLMATLKAESEGILAWLVAGAVAYHRDGLEPSAEVVCMTSDYFKGQDSFRLWLDTCETCDPKDGHGPTRLYASYSQYCADNGFPPDINNNQTAFGKRMRDAQIPSGRFTGGSRRYGLRSIDEASQAEGDPLLD